MAEIRAGARIKASTFNALAPVTGRLASDIGRTSTTTVAATGLSVPVVASALYAVTGYVPFSAPTAGDLKLALVGPTGATGHWGVMAMATNTTGVTGDVTCSRVVGFTTAQTLSVGGVDSEELHATLMGTIQTSTTAGTLALYHAQGTSNGTAATVKSGAWLRLVRIDT
jgi:hypothetical protein